MYEAYVKEKKEAKEEYLAAVNSGQTAAHVEQKWVKYKFKTIFYLKLIINLLFHLVRGIQISSRFLWMWKPRAKWHLILLMNNC